MSEPTPPPPVTHNSEPFLTLHSAIVLLAAGFMGLIVGSLTFLNGAVLAGAVLAGLTAFGASVPTLNRLIQ
ncbi:hypothetical protein SLV14_007021 [Streptomyces sp. Je 1-4]|uniref:hypothetical protein n=1 Tax=Streptomyces TaxID=1883 RepID=UPI00140ED33A|nr:MULTISPECIES: hypothetical protein [unclassified Streptomyces]QIK10207.1 hypothetical protein G7Z12_33265 [Streptomyces sp. ID38640]UYB43974.1 hypothetical protein SLV14_007021 [Streptomyces sp. Je 1-4]UZQ40401.1 hypothetical protein SLV14N_007021 [Streptomyces sp. Je 1-4] [Streptomyces sp. Je 1-4 4N24]UZQ47818.1 hypothetical protein SLV14NA_007021 [Streptomyces sp. Je 1-4] [Streptomyces sp. Je 1-4 4N24_ara]